MIRTAGIFHTKPMPSRMSLMTEPLFSPCAARAVMKNSVTSDTTKVSASKSSATATPETSPAVALPASAAMATPAAAGPMSVVNCAVPWTMPFAFWSCASSTRSGTIAVSAG